MIREISRALEDKMIVLSPEVRDFCEENSKKIAGKAPRFQTMADAWVFLIIEGFSSNRNLSGTLSKTKDAFRWRTVNTNFQAPLILHGLLELELSLEVLFEGRDDANNSWLQILRCLEVIAHKGVLEITND